MTRVTRTDVRHGAGAGDAHPADAGVVVGHVAKLGIDPEVRLAQA